LIARLFLVACGLLTTLPVSAAPDEATGGDARSGGTTVAPLPIIFYTPETKTALGAALNVFWRPAGASEEARPSTLTPVLIYTFNAQVIASLSGSHYWQQEKHNLSSELAYSNFPDVFHGLGNDTSADYEEDVTTESYVLGFDYLRLVRKSLRAGIGATLGHARLLERESTGLLGSGTIPGSAGGWISGIGTSLNFDDRNHITFPTAGGSSTIGIRVFDPSLGSDYDFRISAAESRRYVALGAQTVVATRAVLQHVDGEAPYQLLPSLGGDRLLRGYFGGRFRDRDLIAVEAELRTHLWKRLGLAFFGGIGQVGHNPKDLALDEFHAAGGIGLRVLFLSSEKLHLRFDVGWGKDDGGSYISLGEAF
jgi:outer membrane protein assembly factor BamA